MAAKKLRLHAILGDAQGRMLAGDGYIWARIQLLDQGIETRPIRYHGSAAVAYGSPVLLEYAADGQLEIAMKKRERIALSGTGPYWSDDDDSPRLDLSWWNRQANKVNHSRRCPYCGKMSDEADRGECRHCGGNLYANVK